MDLANMAPVYPSLEDPNSSSLLEGTLKGSVEGPGWQQVTS